MMYCLLCEVRVILVVATMTNLLRVVSEVATYEIEIGLSRRIPEGSREKKLPCVLKSEDRYLMAGLEA